MVYSESSWIKSTPHDQKEVRLTVPYHEYSYESSQQQKSPAKVTVIQVSPLVQAGNSVGECGWGQTPARLQAGSRRAQSDYLASRRAPWRREGGERGGGRKGCYVPNCCIRPISRSTLMQEIHISADITIEMSSCDQPVQWYVARSLALSLFPRLDNTRWKVKKQPAAAQHQEKTFFSGWPYLYTVKVTLKWTNYKYSLFQQTQLSLSYFPPHKIWALTSCLHCSERQCWHEGNLLF